MAINWIAPVRGVQALIAVICLGLSGFLASRITQNSSSQINFNVFVSLWTLLVAAYFIVTGVTSLGEGVMGNSIIVVAIDGLSWVFWLAAFACIGNILNVVVGNVPLSGTFIGCLQALVAFGVINWLLFTATLVWNVLTGFKPGSKSAGSAAPNGGATQGV